MYKTPEQLRAEAAEFEAKAKKLREEAFDADKRQPLFKLADVLHDVLCQANHTDGCGWHYEKEDAYLKEGTTRNRYYKKAKVFMNALQKIDRTATADDAIYLVRALHTNIV